MTWRLESERVIARKNKDSGNLNAILFKCYQVILVSLFISSLSNRFSIGEEGNPETISLHFFFSFFKRRSLDNDGMKLGQTRAILNYMAPKYDLCRRDLKERALCGTFSVLSSTISRNNVVSFLSDQNCARRFHGQQQRRSWCYNRGLAQQRPMRVRNSKLGVDSSEYDYIRGCSLWI